MIDTRQELLIALAEAAEIEHNLACLYLFAAFSIRSDPALDGVSPEIATLLSGWKNTVLGIAKQEMAHLGTVGNLLTAIGGTPHFRRPNFPQPARYYPPEIDFSLERFGLNSLRRFIEFERPEEAAPFKIMAAPEPLNYTRVGDLYRQIRAGFAGMDENTLFLNRDATQDNSSWSLAVQVRAVTGRAEALEAIDFIIEQGEGTPTAPGDSHYERFLAVGQELKARRAADPGFDPARPVVPNPCTRPLRGAVAGSALISDPFTREVAELFAILYGVMLRVLTQFYAFASETPSQRQVLRSAAIKVMHLVLTPLGELLTRLPAGAEFPGLTAGPCFELYGEEALSNRPRVAWEVIVERLDLHAGQARQLAAQANAGAGPVLTAAANQLTAIAGQLRAVHPA